MRCVVIERWSQFASSVAQVLGTSYSVPQALVIEPPWREEIQYTEMAD